MLKPSKPKIRIVLNRVDANTLNNINLILKYENDSIETNATICTKIIKIEYFRKTANPRVEIAGSVSKYSSGIKNIDIMGFLRNAAKVVAAAFIPGVLQKISIVKPNKNPNKRVRLLLVLTGNFIIK